MEIFEAFIGFKLYGILLHYQRKHGLKTLAEAGEILASELLEKSTNPPD